MGGWDEGVATLYTREENPNLFLTGMEIKGSPIVRDYFQGQLC